ncbi:TRAP transporter small permease subunit [Falsiroseomonas selenitidurans]|uniref:TRAP transporter small permease protein n=1 Tax=Falsiroseomonas selenitidurans TaxID=2716335 RepID=A0ABX1E3Y0_9PROT|nr:TRAP transporter small permease subunit [Falsiroseomonas selenitidurans]NKC31891.1 TRAP transporter small permease subunit [Falsiroseomonas selenitidurans]
MQPILIGIDKLSAFIGKLFAWLILALTLSICYEVFARYLFRAPTTWVFDASYMMYGTLFMMAGAYTLSRGGHVRADFAYRLQTPRRQAMLDLILYVIFFIPAMIGLIIFGWDFFVISYGQNEQSSVSPDGPLVWPFKFIIPFAAAVVLLQGVAEIVRCWICIRDGDWPQKLNDVEEMEVLALEQARRAQERAAG